MCGDLSHGGVVKGLNLEPEPLYVKWCSHPIRNQTPEARAFECGDSVCLCVNVCK